MRGGPGPRGCPSPRTGRAKSEAEQPATGQGGRGGLGDRLDAAREWELLTEASDSAAVVDQRADGNHELGQRGELERASRAGPRRELVDRAPRCTALRAVEGRERLGPRCGGSTGGKEEAVECAVVVGSRDG